MARSKPAWQERNALDTARRAREILSERGVEKVSDSARPEQVEEILEAAKDTSAAEIKELFARLLASAVDPTRQHYYRSDFVGIVKQFEPLDAAVLKAMGKPGVNPDRWKTDIKGEIHRSDDELALSAKNLHRLDCLESQPNMRRIENNALITARGRQLLALLA